MDGRAVPHAMANGVASYDHGPGGARRRPSLARGRGAALRAAHRHQLLCWLVDGARRQVERAVEHTVDWRPLYPGRVPLIGQYTTEQSTMDGDIVAASSAGVDFFSILWYDNYPCGHRAPGSGHLNDGLSLFMSSKEAHRMQFMIEWCIALPLFGVHSDMEWQRMVRDDWLPAFKHQSYLRVGGALVFKVHSGPAFKVNSSASDAVVSARLDFLRRLVRNAGLGEMILGAGSTITDTSDPAEWWGFSYNFTNDYAGVLHDDPKWAGRVLPWRNESAFVREWRRKQARAAAQANPRRTFVPTVVSGWDPRPWREQRASYTFPTASEWRQELQMIASDLQDYGTAMGLPVINDDVEGGGGGQNLLSTTVPAFTIYAWNEFGEGGIMAPCVAWNSSRLEEVSAVFPPMPNVQHGLHGKVSEASRAAAALQRRVDAAVASGGEGAHVEIAPGDYNFSTSALTIRGGSGLTLIGPGAGVANLWFAPGSGLEVLQSTNVTVGGFTIDSHQAPFSQGKIVSLNWTQKSIVMRLEEGFLSPTAPALFSRSGENKVVYWDSKSRLMVQGQQMQNPMLSADSASDVDPSLYTLRLSTLNCCPGPSVGDLITVSPRFFSTPNPIPTFYKGTVFVGDSSDVHIRDIAIHSSATMALLEVGGEGRHLYSNISIARRPGPLPLGYGPPRLLASNSDGFHSFAVGHGGVVEDCTLTFLADDFINVHNRVWLMLSAPAGQQPGAGDVATTAIIVDPGNTFGHNLATTHSASLVSPGTPLRVFSKDKTLLANVIVESVAEIVDADQLPTAIDVHHRASKSLFPIVNIEPGSIRAFEVNFTNGIPVFDVALVQYDLHCSQGAVIRRNLFSDSYNNVGRFAAPNILVEDNEVRRCGDGVHAEFLAGFLEGSLGVVSNITFTNNRFTAVRGCGAQRVGTTPCDHVCTNMTCVLSHVGQDSRVGQSGNLVAPADDQHRL